MKEVKKVNMVDILSIQVGIWNIQPVEITVRRGVR
jgi:hypothetical protein